MTRKQIRSLVFTELASFDTALANVFYENLEGGTNKGDTWIRASVRFGTSSEVALGLTEGVGVLFLQVFYKKDTGGAIKDVIVDDLASLYDFKTLSDLNGYIQFRGGTEVFSPEDGGYLQAQYSIPFNHYKENS